MESIIGLCLQRKRRVFKGKMQLTLLFSEWQITNGCGNDAQSKIGETKAHLTGTKAKGFGGQRTPRGSTYGAGSRVSGKKRRRRRPTTEAIERNPRFSLCYPSSSLFGYCVLCLVWPTLCRVFFLFSLYPLRCVSV